MSTDWRQMILERIESGPEIALQPIVSLVTGDLIGYEALSRFPEMPESTPDEWFRHAGIYDLDRELEVAAVAAALEFLPQIEKGAYLSINASARTLISEPFILAVLGRFSSRVVVELTEHDVVENYDELNKQLSRIRAKKTLLLSIPAEGVLLGIDDFGAGAANIRHLLEMDPDIIKFDISLTRNIDALETERQAQLVAAISQFATTAGISTIAEGVETEAERLRLRELGVNNGQGFLFGRPKLVRRTDESVKQSAP